MVDRAGRWQGPRYKKLGYALVAALKGPSGSSHHVINGLKASISIDVCHHPARSQHSISRGWAARPISAYNQNLWMHHLTEEARRTFLFEPIRETLAVERRRGRNAIAESTC